jgi:hypothetical protein
VTSHMSRNHKEQFCETCDMIPDVSLSRFFRPRPRGSEPEKNKFDAIKRHRFRTTGVDRAIKKVKCF